MAAPTTYRELLALDPCPYRTRNIDTAALYASTWVAGVTAAASKALTLAHSAVSPIVVAFVPRTDPNRIHFLKQIEAYPGQIGHAGGMDNIAVGILGLDLATAFPHALPDDAFDLQANVRVMDDIPGHRAALTDANPIHDTVATGTADSSELQVRRAIVLPTQWADRTYAIGANGMTHAEFFDEFLRPLIDGGGIGDFEPVQQWWRCASTRQTAGVDYPRLSVTSPLDAVGLGIRNDVTVWTRQRVNNLFRAHVPFQPPLSGNQFNAAMNTLRADLQAQHQDREDREDRRDAPQDFEGRFGAILLDEALRYTGVASQNDLPDTLRNLARNKKKSDDAIVLQTAIDARAADAQSVGTEYSKPQVTVRLIGRFRDLVWAATGEDPTEGLTVFNILYATEATARAAKERVSHLSTLESGNTAMSHADSITLHSKDMVFPNTLDACVYRLQAHSILVDIMLGPANGYAVAYRTLVRDIDPLFRQVIYSHYGNDALSICLRILYWLTQQWLQYLRNLKLGLAAPIPDFDALLGHIRVRNVESHIGKLPANWTEHAPRATRTEGGATRTNTRVNNPKYDATIRKRWNESGLDGIKKMERNKPADNTTPIPKFGTDEACLSYLLKGYCWDGCTRKDTHKHAGPAVVTAAHAYMDACGVPPSSS